LAKEHVTGGRVHRVLMCRRLAAQVSSTFPVPQINTSHTYINYTSTFQHYTLNHRLRLSTRLSVPSTMNSLLPDVLYCT